MKNGSWTSNIYKSFIPSKFYNVELEQNWNWIVLKYVQTNQMDGVDWKTQEN